MMMFFISGDSDRIVIYFLLLALANPSIELWGIIPTVPKALPAYRLTVKFSAS
jgi:hypothetical protein